MVFKTLSLAMAPDGDPEKHRAKIKTGSFESTNIIIRLGDYDTAVRIAKQMVEKEGVNSVSLCPGFTHSGVAKVAEAVRGRAGVTVARGDPESMAVIGPILEREGFMKKP